MTEQEKQLQIRIRELEKEVARLQTEIKKNSQTQYGLRWMDVPEAFEAESVNAIPILEEVREKSISNNDGKPTHILIEGDNFHALTCLNYTHKGQIDVIYIDPPYNTGSDGFVYKDKRVLDKFPDGTTVPTDHPLRHSYWLSFMHKRLELAKNLLSDRGVIFISIDDNEQANLKLLCDKVFGEENFVANIIRRNKAGAGHDAREISIEYDYMMLYSKNKKHTTFNKDKVDVENDVKYKLSDKYVDYRGKYYLRDLDYKGSYSESLDYPINLPNGKIIYSGGKHGKPNTWRWSKEKFQWGLDNDFIVIDEKKEKIYIKQYQFVDNENNQRQRVIPFRADVSYLNSEGSVEMNEIIKQTIFSYPKPTSLIEYAEKLASSPSSIILDFFAGSGTTLHATMKLNEEDGGHRQCILVQQNENNICEAVTYERNRRVMQGYTNAKGEQVAGLGNSMKYYKTAFVGKNTSRHATDSDRVELSLKAGYLLALGENTLEEIQTTKSYQIFTDKQGKYTAVYFTGNLSDFADFVNTIETIQKEKEHPQIAVYIFCWGSVDIYENEFDNLSGITLKPIPQPILDIYKSINA
ncbi:MAG: site-specific DNA-methyltransferase [Bacteroidales bacterium]|nr:site-specific DNA-methyltransferase [Bacteroidales bacterium]